MYAASHAKRTLPSGPARCFEIFSSAAPSSSLLSGLESRPDKRPTLSDLRESGALEQDADVVMFLYREEVYNPDNKDEIGAAELNISKHRAGPLGKVRLAWLAAYTRFENFASDSRSN